MGNIKRAIALALIAAPLVCYADSSYQHTTQITGGQLVAMIKNLSFFSKQMRSMTDPNNETTMVHGNQKAIVGKDYTEIWDLDKEVIIHVDNTKHSYSVMTFADMRKAMAELPAKMAQMQEQMKEQQAKMQQQQGQAPALPPNLQFNFTVDVQNTGLTKMIEKYEATQQILTMKMICTDTNNPGTSVTYTTTTEIWTTPDVPAEMKDVQDFDMRFGMKMMQGADVKDLMASMANMRNGGQMMMAQLFGSKPGAADAFAQMGKEMAKIKGTRLVEITRMGGSGTGIDTGAANGSGANGGNGQTSSGNGQPAQNNASVFSSGGLGGALIGAFHKKKQQQDAQAAPAPAAPAGQAPGQPQDVTLMEMTTSTHAFSNDPVSLSAFQVPAGYKQVPSPMEQMMSK